MPKDNKNSIDLFEAVRKGEITPTEAARVMEKQRNNQLFAIEKLVLKWGGFTTMSLLIVFLALVYIIGHYIGHYAR